MGPNTLQLKDDLKEALSLVLDYAYEKMADDPSLNKGRHTDLLIAVKRIEDTFDV